MRSAKIFLVAISFASLVCSYTLKRPNPAYLKCIESKGQIETRKDSFGNEDGVCMWNNPKSECGQWAFFRGECAPGECSVWSIDTHSCAEPI